MTYYPHTKADRQKMLEAIGVNSIETLFEAVPEAVRFPHLDLPPGLSQLEIGREMAARHGGLLSEKCGMQVIKPLGILFLSGKKIKFGLADSLFGVCNPQQELRMGLIGFDKTRLSIFEENIIR